MDQIILPLLFGGAFVLFPILLVVFIVVSSRRAARRRGDARAAARAGGRPARARVLDLRRAGAQRSDEFVLVKYLLEVAPADGGAPFSVAVVWEVAPAAVGALVPGAELAVKIDREDARMIYPEFAEARFSYLYRHAFLAIDDDFAPVEELAAAGAVAPAAPPPKRIFRQRSRIVVAGWPLWEVAFNLSRNFGARRYVPKAEARALVAIGGSATGLIAFGGIARGVVAVGHIAIGVVSFGGISIGVVSIGSLALGAAALGFLGAGLFAIGFFSGGYASAGALSAGVYVFNDVAQSPEMTALVRRLGRLTGLSLRELVYAAAAPLAGVLGYFALTLVVAAFAKTLAPNSRSLASPRPGR